MVSDFDDMYERGLVDQSGMPTWDDEPDSSDNKTYKKYQEYKSNLEVMTHNDITSITVELTPKSYLKSVQLEARKELEKNHGVKLLSIKHNKYNDNDRFALEIYYNDIFVGYIRKKYKSEGINNTTIINDFCFNKIFLRNLNVTYCNSKCIIENLNPYNKKEDEWVNSLYAWAEKYGVLNDLSSNGTLNLIDKNLPYLPKEIGNLINIDGLYLENNQIAALPKEIGNLVNLKTLNLNGNNLTTLPNEISNLVNLHTIEVENNDLTSLPKGIGNLVNLDTLYAANNDLVSLPREIGNLFNLKILFLNSNQLSTLPKEIGNLINLENLGLSLNQLTSLPMDIKKFSKLESLDLRYNKIILSDYQVNQIKELEKMGCSVSHNIAQLKPEIQPLTFSLIIDIIIAISIKSFYFLILGLIFYIVGG